MESKFMSFMGFIFFIFGLGLIVYGVGLGIDLGVGTLRIANLGMGVCGLALTISGAIFWAVGSALGRIENLLKSSSSSHPVAPAMLSTAVRPSQSEHPNVGEFVVYKGKKIIRQDEYLVSVDGTTYPLIKMARDAIDRGAHGPLSGLAP